MKRVKLRLEKWNASRTAQSLAAILVITQTSGYLASFAQGTIDASNMISRISLGFKFYLCFQVLWVSWYILSRPSKWAYASIKKYAQSLHRPWTYDD